MVIGRPVAAQMQPHAKVRAKSAARRLDRGMPARVAREDAAMERRPARASRQRLAAERQHPRRSADRRSVPFGLADRGNQTTGSPGPPITGAFPHGHSSLRGQAVPS